MDSAHLLLSMVVVRTRTQNGYALQLMFEKLPSNVRLEPEADEPSGQVSREHQPIDDLILAPSNALI